MTNIEGKVSAEVGTLTRPVRPGGNAASNPAEAGSTPATGAPDQSLLGGTPVAGPVLDGEYELGQRLLELADPMLEGPDVAAWQRIIRTHPVTGRERLDEGSVFGPVTDTVTRIWQVEHGLIPDGIIGPECLLSARSVTEPEGKRRPLPEASEVREAERRRERREKKVRT